MPHELPVVNRVRERRLAAGLSQAELARRAGVTRQAVNAIELGRVAPGVGVALRLAETLGCQVEDLFRLPEVFPRVRARVVGKAARREGPAPGPTTRRARVAMVGAEVVALPIHGPLEMMVGFTEAEGFLQGGAGEGLADVELLVPRERLAETVVVAGCDPALPLLAAQLARVAPRFRLAGLSLGSRQALLTLREGGAHVAGLHVRDPETGEPNLPLIRDILAGHPCVVVGYATWEEGLLVAPGNPRGIHGAADLARPGVRIVNREPGSGARALLDQVLAAAGVDPARVEGYGTEATSHLAVAQAVALGLVDAGVGVRAVGRALGLEFVPLQQNRYDLVIPLDHLEHPPVQALLEALQRRAFRLEVEAAGGYDTTRAGSILARLPGSGSRAAQESDGP